LWRFAYYAEYKYPEAIRQAVSQAKEEKLNIYVPGGTVTDSVEHHVAVLYKHILVHMATGCPDPEHGGKVCEACEAFAASAAPAYAFVDTSFVGSLTSEYTQNRSSALGIKCGIPE
jgi:hypothetical protein